MLTKTFEAVLAAAPWLCALIALLLAVRRMSGARVRARTFRSIWFILAVRAALPVQVTLPDAPVRVEFTAWEEKPVTVFRMASEAGPAVPSVRETVPVFSWFTAAAGVWAAVAAGLTVWCVVRGMSFAVRLFRNRTRVEGHRRVFLSPLADVPFAFGLLRPAVYLPEHVKDGDIPYILEHEMRHIRAGDLWLQAALLAAQCVQWFNPLVHIMAGMARRDMELACDEAVLENRAIKYRIRYAQTVLNAMRGARRKTLLAAPLCGRGTNKVRWKEMFNMKQKKKAGALPAAVCASVILASLLMGCNAAAGTAQNPDLVESVTQSASLGLNAQKSTPESDVQPEQTAVSGEADEVVWPVPEFTYITRGFMQGTHRGLDICAPNGSDILAVQGGTVTISSADEANGNYVEIDCGNGLIMRYTHCNELYVERGQVVETGELIAAVGTTGKSAGNHCHLEMEHNGTLFDPEELLTIPY